MSMLRLRDTIEQINIVDIVDDETLAMMGERVRVEFDMDNMSRDLWIKRNDQYIKMAAQYSEKKTFPWPDASNVKFPLITTAAMQFAARAYPSLVPPTDIVYGVVLGKDDEGEKRQRAIRVAKYMNYQLRYEMEEWQEEMDKMCMLLPIIGCVFKKTYFDNLLQRNVSQLILPDDLVVNYRAKDLATAVRKTHVIYLTKNEVFERKASGIFRDVELGEPSNTRITLRDDSDEIQGLTDQGHDESAGVYTILEQHRYWDLDGDGYEEPWVVTVDYHSKEVLRIAARFTDKGIKSVGERIVKIEPEEYFTKFGFVPNPDGGFYDVGFGVLLGGVNAAVNTIINQMIDSGTMYNSQGGFLGRGVRIPGGVYTVTPFEWKHVNTTVDDLRKAIFPFPAREPSMALFQLLGMLAQSGKELASIAEIFTGKMPGQNTPATTTMATIEQGLKVFTAIYHRIYRSMTKEFELLYKLNSQYLDEMVARNVLDDVIEIGREDFNDETVDIKPSANPDMATETQRYVKMQAVGELIALGQINPQQYTQMVLNSLQLETSEIEALLKMPEAQPNPELVLKQQELEHEMWKDKMEIMLDAAKTEAEVLKSKAQAIQALASAEAQEAGSQMEVYNSMLKSIDEQTRTLEARMGMIQQQLNGPYTEE